MTDLGAETPSWLPTAILQVPKIGLFLSGLPDVKRRKNRENIEGNAEQNS